MQAQLAHRWSTRERAGEQNLLRLGVLAEGEQCECRGQHGHQPLESLLIRGRHASPFAHHFGNR